MANSDAKLIIDELEIRCCRVAQDDGVGMRGDTTLDALEFLVYTLTTISGQRASMFGFAGRSALGSGHLAASSLRPFLVGNNALDRELLWHQWRTADRWWHHLPIYSYGPADCCLWIIAAQDAGQPLWRYLGGGREQVPVYASSLALTDAKAYADEACAVRDAGLQAYKIHPPGKSLQEDMEIHRAVRAAVGPDFTLMSDPVAPYTLEEAIKMGRLAEQLDYLWYEEPLPDEAFGALKELTRVLDIPVVGTEVLAKHPYSVAQCIGERVVDAVRADVSWTGGITGTIKTARTAEAFHMNCEIHTSIFHPLELVNLHVCASVLNSTYFELLWPLNKFAFGLSKPLPIDKGIATLPTGAGLGIELDWNFIDDATFKVL